MLLLCLILPTIRASGLSSATGEIVGFVYIALTVSLICLIFFFIYKKSEVKGLKASLIQLSVFVQFFRYSGLINFAQSEFYVKALEVLFMTQDPFEVFECTKAGLPWNRFGFDSTNFLCNSWALLCFTGLAMLICALCIVFVKENKDFKDFIIVILYCTESDLAFSAFLQLKFVSFIKISFSGAINILGSCVAIAYLVGALAMLMVQSYYIYRNRNLSWIICMITEEFQQDKEYYYYMYYPSFVFCVLFHMCLLVFSQDRPFTVPIVISIIILFNCSIYLVSYIVSIRPFAQIKSIIFVAIVQILEIIILYIPMLYNYNVLNFSFIDVLSIILFSLVIFFMLVRIYFIIKDFVPISPQSQVLSASNLKSNEEQQESSIINFIDDPEKKSFSGFLHTFKPPLPKKKPNKIQPELNTNNPDTATKINTHKKGSYFMKPFQRAPKNIETVNLSRLPDSVIEEEVNLTSRFNLNSSQNSETRIIKMPENTPVTSHKLIIKNFSELDNMSEERGRVNKINSYEETPRSNNSSVLRSRFNINEFTVRNKLDKKSEISYNN